MVVNFDPAEHGGLVVARGPDGRTYIFSAFSSEEVFSFLDEYGDPGEFTVEPYEGLISIQLSPPKFSSVDGEVVQVGMVPEVPDDEGSFSVLQDEVLKMMFPRVHKSYLAEQPPAPQALNRSVLATCRRRSPRNED